RIGIDPVTYSCQKAAGTIIAEVVTVRGYGTEIDDVFSPHAPSLKNSVPDRRRPAVVDAATGAFCPVFAERAAVHRQHPPFVVDAAAAAREIQRSGIITAKSAIGDSQRRAAVDAIVVDAATAGAGGIAAEPAVADGNGCGAFETFVGDRTATAAGVQ